MHKKKIIAIFALLATCLLLNALLSGRIDRTKAYADATEPNISQITPLQNLNAFGNSDGRYDLIKQFIYAVLLVGALGIAAWYLSRKVVPRLANARGRHVSVIESVPLGPNKMLHLVEVPGGKRLLIGSTSQAVNFLTEITTSTTELPEAPSPQQQV